MDKKKGYGLVIPANWKAGKWDKLTTQEIVNQLRVLNHDAFYRGSGVIPWQSYPKMIDKRYMKNGRSDTPCS